MVLRNMAGTLISVPAFNNTVLVVSVNGVYVGRDMHDLSKALLSAVDVFG
jgi:hypothetical protein